MNVLQVHVLMMANALTWSMTLLVNAKQAGREDFVMKVSALQHWACKSPTDGEWSDSDFFDVSLWNNSLFTPCYSQTSWKQTDKLTQMSAL